MRFGRLIGWGITIYAVVYLAWSGLVIHGLELSIFARFIVLFALAAVTIVATKSLGYRTERDILPYAIGWMIIVGLLDAVYAVPFGGWAIYTDWNMWVGYFLVLIIPIVVTLASREKSAM
jgi:hypothetical protein